MTGILHGLSVEFLWLILWNIVQKVKVCPIIRTSVLDYWDNQSGWEGM